MKLDQKKKDEIRFWVEKAKKVIDNWEKSQDSVAAQILSSKFREIAVYIDRSIQKMKTN